MNFIIRFYCSETDHNTIELKAPILPAFQSRLQAEELAGVIGRMATCTICGALMKWTVSQSDN